MGQSGSRGKNSARLAFSPNLSHGDDENVFEVALWYTSIGKLTWLTLRPGTSISTSELRFPAINRGRRPARRFQSECEVSVPVRRVC